MSNALIEGVERAGNRFTQSVGEGEKLDGKIIRMLRGALTPSNGAYVMEVQYRKREDEDFVLVEKVTDSLRVMIIDEGASPDTQLDRELRESVFVTTQKNEETDIAVPDADGQAHYSYLPTVSMPKLLQTPQHVPPLYPLSRTTVYIIISPGAAQGTPISVILRGVSSENPFEMKIPVEILGQPGTTIHQHAAKKAIVELEEGRGWLGHPKDDNETLIKEKYRDHIEAMVEREAVRLGVQYQVAGKYTSFLAVQSDTEDPESPKFEIASFEGSTNTPPSVIQSSKHVLGGSNSQPVHHNRTKQTARQSTRGKSPRKQLASMAAMPPPSPPSGSASKKKKTGTGRGTSNRGGGAFRHRRILVEAEMDEDEDQDEDE